MQVHAGPRASAILRERGLQPEDVRVIPGAAGGPKGLILNPLDRYIFSRWLDGTTHTLHLPGASIGAWRLAAACLPDADAALAQLADDYIEQRYDHAPGKAPTPAHVSATFAAKLDQRLGARAADVLSHPQRRLHVFTSRGRHVLRREGRWRTPVGYLGAWLANAASRRARFGLGGWIERVVFSDPRDPLPFGLADFRSRQVPLTAHNLSPAVLASCSIPFWLKAVADVPGGPPGAYWDGGITDYHLHLDYAAMEGGIVLYPHFQPRIVPGWLDKTWTRRHRASPALDNVVVLAPSADWIATLPNAKLPDRADFKAYGDDVAGRIRAWRRAVADSERLADDFAALDGKTLDPLPLR